MFNFFLRSIFHLNLFVILLKNCLELCLIFNSFSSDDWSEGHLWIITLFLGCLIANLVVNYRLGRFKCCPPRPREPGVELSACDFFLVRPYEPLVFSTSLAFLLSVTLLDSKSWVFSRRMRASDEPPIQLESRRLAWLLLKVLLSLVDLSMILLSLLGLSTSSSITRLPFLVVGVLMAMLLPGRLEDKLSSSSRSSSLITCDNE